MTTKDNDDFVPPDFDEITKNMQEMIDVLKSNPPTIPAHILVYCMPFILKLEDPEFRKALLGLVDHYQKISDYCQNLEPGMVMHLASSNVPVPLNAHFGQWMEIFTLFQKRMVKKGREMKSHEHDKQ